jgi:ATP synthase protein I
VKTLRPVIAPVLLLTGVCAAIAGAVRGGDGAAGAVVGGVVVCLFFLSSRVALEPLTKASPQSSLLAAVVFYATKVVALLALFTVLLDPDGAGARLDEKSLGATVIITTIAWTTLQIRAARRARIPLYDLGDKAP